VEKVSNIGVVAFHSLLAVGQNEGEQCRVAVANGTHQGVESRLELGINILRECQLYQ